VNELLSYAFSPLREGDIALYRGSGNGLPPILLVAAEETSLGCVERIEHEYALKAELDADWAARPMALTHYNDRMTLVLEDPGGAPLDQLLGRQQVIINLVMNGIEAMQSVTDRPRELVIRSHQDEAQRVLVTVMDSGVGISAEKADRLFNAFFTTKSGGMGMGLSICRSIVEAHGGRMSVANNDGHGATFQFVLPLHQEDAS
jgi:signal transduction histidine kinase